MLAILTRLCPFDVGAQSCVKVKPHAFIRLFNGIIQSPPPRSIFLFEPGARLLADDVSDLMESNEVAGQSCDDRDSDTASRFIIDIPRPATGPDAYSPRPTPQVDLNTMSATQSVDVSN
jgi:hypothetical protein